MAKKAVRKLEEEEEARSFDFPTFDEAKFVAHEFEQSYATGIAIGLAAVFGVLSYLIERATAPGIVAAVVGIALIAFSPFLYPRLRPLAGEYTRGEWAGLLVTELFGWMGIWFLLLNVLPIT